MTLAEVKRDLPNVPIMFNGKVFQARVTGRLNRQATVTISEGYSHALQSAWVDFHFSWEAVTKAVNSGNPLKT